MSSDPFQAQVYRQHHGYAYDRIPLPCILLASIYAAPRSDETLLRYIIYGSPHTLPYVRLTDNFNTGLEDNTSTVHPII